MQKLNNSADPSRPHNGYSISFVYYTGDQQFIEFLEQEIKTEKEESRALPSISGFEVKPQGPMVTLTKQMDSEM